MTAKDTEERERLEMGINFDRFQQRTGEKSWWSNVGIQEFYEYDGHWVGVLPPAEEREMKFLPYVYFGQSEVSNQGSVTARECGEVSTSSRQESREGVLVQPNFRGRI